MARKASVDVDSINRFEILARRASIDLDSINSQDLLDLGTGNKIEFVASAILFKKAIRHLCSEYHLCCTAVIYSFDCIIIFSVIVTVCLKIILEFFLPNQTF